MEALEALEINIRSQSRVIEKVVVVEGLMIIIGCQDAPIDLRSNCVDSIRKLLQNLQCLDIILDDEPKNTFKNVFEGLKRNDEMSLQFRKLLMIILQL